MTAWNNDQSLKELLHTLCKPLAPEPTGVPPRLRVVGRIRAVLFDVYGTLLISGAGEVGTHGSAADPAQAFKDALKLCSMPEVSARQAEEVAGILRESIEAFHARLRAQGCSFPEVDILRVWREVFRRLSYPVQPEVGVLRRFAFCYECLINPVWPMPQMQEVLRTLKESGRTLGIVSNAQFFTPICLEAFLGCPLGRAGFEPDLLAWSYRYLEAKPSPELFKPVLAALKRRGITPHETLYVGNDMLNDIKPAAALACRTALFAGDRRSYRPRTEDTRLAELRPTLVLTELAQLLEIL